MTRVLIGFQKGETDIIVGVLMLQNRRDLKAFSKIDESFLKKFCSYLGSVVGNVSHCNSSVRVFSPLKSFVFGLALGVYLFDE